MARWSLYRFTRTDATTVDAVLEQLTSGAAFYDPATGAAFVVPARSTNAIVTASIAKPSWGRSDPPPDQGPVPDALTGEQIRKALEAIGKLASVQAAITAMSEPRRTQAQIEWDRRGTYERLHPIVLNLQAAFSLTSAQVDALFRAGAAI